MKTSSVPEEDKVAAAIAVSRNAADLSRLFPYTFMMLIMDSMQRKNRGSVRAASTVRLARLKDFGAQKGTLWIRLPHIFVGGENASYIVPIFGREI